MGAIASQITSLTIIFSAVYLDTDQRKHQSSASLAFVRGIHRSPVNSPHKLPVTRKCFHLMTSSWTGKIRQMLISHAIIMSIAKTPHVSSVIQYPVSDTKQSNNELANEIRSIAINIAMIFTSKNANVITWHSTILLYGSNALPATDAKPRQIWTAGDIMLTTTHVKNTSCDSVSRSSVVQHPLPDTNAKQRQSKYGGLEFQTNTGG